MTTQGLTMKQLEEIQARHEAAKQALDDESYYSGKVAPVFPTNEGKRAHADRALLLAEVERLKEAAQKFRDLVDDLSGEEPMSQDEMGGCVWCGGTPPDKGHYAYATAEPDSHDPECPWLLARAALKEPAQ